MKKKLYDLIVYLYLTELHTLKKWNIGIRWALLVKKSFEIEESELEKISMLRKYYEKVKPNILMTKIWL